MRTYKGMLRRAGAQALWMSGVTAACLKQRGRGAALVLSYHRIGTHASLKSRPVMGGMYTASETFQRHMTLLLRHYKIVPLTDLIARIRRQERWDAPLCAVTFDDGWHDNYEQAYPTLKAMGIPATIFVTGAVGVAKLDAWQLCFEIALDTRRLPDGLTGYPDLDRILSGDMNDRTEKARRAGNIVRTLPMADYDDVQKKLDDYFNTLPDAAARRHRYRTLSWSDMRTMQPDGIEIGYHSRSHYMLTRLPVGALNDELSLPGEAAQNGVTFNKVFCYPDGQHNDTIVDHLKRLGYVGATTLIRGLNDTATDPYRLRRRNIHEGFTASPAEFLYAIATA